MCVHTRFGVYVIRGQNKRMSSLLQPYGSWGLDSSCQAEQEAVIII